MNTPADTQLKQALAKMLPEEVSYETNLDQFPEDLYWIRSGHTVLDTELLHLCWLVEETLGKEDTLMFCIEMDIVMDLKAIHATWQQRVLALCKVKGVAIV